MMVFFHGGGFVVGTGSSAFYDGTKLAASEVIVVTINYRSCLCALIGVGAVWPHGCATYFSITDYN